MSNQEKSMPRPEYPRPQMARSTWQNLNGEWEFEQDRANSGRERALFRAEHLAEHITVPFCMESILSGVGDTDFCESVWYRREIQLDPSWLSDGKHVILNIGACDYRTEVYVNGEWVGRHLGGYVSFSFDITRYVKAGGNSLVIHAEDKLRSGEQPAGKQSPRYASYGCFYTRTTGIWQTVWLESVAAAYVKSFRLYPNTADATLGIIGSAEAPNGTPVRAVAAFGGVSVGEARGTVCGKSFVLTLPLSELHLWELGKGNLYDLTLYCGDDEVASYFGMRTVSLTPDGGLLINGKRVFQRLVLDQGFYPDGIYTAPSEEELVHDIERSVAMGFHGARLHQKVFEPLFLYHCDRLGYIVWGEHANWVMNESAPTAYKGFLSEWREIVERDFNHPAIIGWCPLNETKITQDPDLVRTVAEVTRAIDPTRPVIDTSGWVHEDKASDIVDWHDYDQDPESFRRRYIDVANGTPISRPRKLTKAPLFPTFISEYGGIKWDVNSHLDNAWGYGNAPKTEQEFIERFKGLAEALLFNPFINGLCYTQLTDVEQETNGLYTYDRQPKFDPDIFRAVLTQRAAWEDKD